jgi:hypothetical protein
MRITLAFCAALLASQATAQLSPPSPTTNDVISYRVVLPAACPYESSAHVDGFHIDVTVVSPGGICLSVVTVVNVQIGTLRAGTYTVTVTRSFAGETTTFTDSFVVRAGGGDSGA